MPDSIDAIFTGLAAAPGQRITVHVKHEIRDYHFADLREQVEAGAAALAGFGLRKGARFALLSGNSWQCMCIDLITLARGDFLLHLVGSAEAELVDWVRRERLDAIITTALPEALAAWPELVPIGTLQGFTLYALPGAAKEESMLVGVPGVIFSSGTSGRIKKIRLNGKGIVPAARAFFGTAALSGTDRFLIFLPLSNYQQKLLVYGCLLYGLGFCLAEPDTVLPALRRYSPTAFLAPPLFYETAWRLSRVSATTLDRNTLHAGGTPDGTAFASQLSAWFGGQMRIMWSGMAPIPPRILEDYRAAGVPLVEAYGMTEFGPITMNTLDRNRPGSVGIPLHPDGFSLAPDGEILLHVPQPLTLGYLDEPPEAEAEVYLPSGWIATGDLGQSDAEGFLNLHGRKKELIITSAGIKLHPQEIERFFIGVSNLNHAVLLGNGRANPGMLFMVQKAEPALQGALAGIVAEVNHSVCQAAQIRKWHVEIGEFSPGNKMLTRNFKLARKNIAARYEDLVFE